MQVINLGGLKVADFEPGEPIKTEIMPAKRENDERIPQWWEVRISQGKGDLLVLRLTAKQWHSICDATLRDPLLHVMMEAEASVAG